MSLALTMKSLAILLISCLWIIECAAENSAKLCPKSIQPPCYCTPGSNHFSAPSVTCERATPLQVALVIEFMDGNTELENLTITDTPMPRLAPFTFGGKVHVNRLLFNRNGLTGIHPLFFHNSVVLDEITDLDLSDNLLITFPMMISQLRNLEVVRLANNKMTRVPSGIFENLRNLKLLDLSHNNVVSADYGAFRNMPSLVYLDLSFNQLQVLEFGILDRTFSSPEMFGRTRFLCLCENPWRCDHTMSWFRQWLKKNREIQIDYVGCLAVCHLPEHLKGWPLRQFNDYHQAAPVPIN